MASQVAIFWDLDNFNWRLSKFYGANPEEMTINVVDRIWDIYKDDKVRIFSAYADFERVPRIQSEIQKKRVITKHVLGPRHRSDLTNHKSDIELSLDALETLIRFPEIDCYAIASADKDMIPLMNRIRYYGKSIHLLFLEAFIATDGSFWDYADKVVSLELLLGLEPIKFDPIDMEKLVLPGVSLVNSFYLRNAGKPNMYLGKEFFISEAVAILKITRQNAIELLELCLNRECLAIAFTEDNHEKVIVPATVEQLMFNTNAQITSARKSE